MIFAEIEKVQSSRGRKGMVFTVLRGCGKKVRLYANSFMLKVNNDWRPGHFPLLREGDRVKIAFNNLGNPIFWTAA